MYYVLQWLCQSTINFESNNDNIFDVLGFVSTSNKFIPQYITQYALSPNKVALNNISNFFISVDIVHSCIQNGLRNNIIHVEPISVSPSSTQVIQPLQIAYLPINKNSIIYQITATLLGDNNFTYDRWSKYNKYAKNQRNITFTRY